MTRHGICEFIYSKVIHVRIHLWYFQGLKSLRGLTKIDWSITRLNSMLVHGLADTHDRCFAPAPRQNQGYNERHLPHNGKPYVTKVLSIHALSMIHTTHRTIHDLNNKDIVALTCDSSFIRTDHEPCHSHMHLPRSPQSNRQIKREAHRNSTSTTHDLSIYTVPDIRLVEKTPHVPTQSTPIGRHTAGRQT